MGFEPRGVNRLHLVMSTTRDAQLRGELEIALTPSPHSVDCAELAEPVDGFGLEPSYEALTAPRPLAGELAELMRDVMTSSDAGAELLGALRSHVTALHALWQAYEHGAAKLPDNVARLVAQARSETPHCLAGGYRARLD